MTTPLLACLLCPLALADTPQPMENKELVVLIDSFDDGAGRWRPQGEGLKVDVIEVDGNRMVRLDNSAGTTQAFLGTTAGDRGELLRFSLDAKTADGEPGQVGLHRFAGGIHWVTIGGEWQSVGHEMRGHETGAGWYVVVPAGKVILIDNVRLERVVLTDAMRRERLAQIRRESEATALAEYRELGCNMPGPATSLTVNGDLPVGLYTVRPTSGREMTLDQILAELAAAGFNFVHNSDFEDWPEHAANYAQINSDETARRYLDTAQANGLKVLMGFDRMMVVKSNLEGLRSRARALSGHPALWGWYLIDEPNLHGATPEAVRSAYVTLREAAPAVPVTACLCTPQSFADYAPGVDVIITDVYPVSTHSLFALAPHLERALKVTGGRKPVWAAIQVHNNDLHQVRWGGLGGILTEPRRPTPDEVRCMTYLAIAHGASGIFFYAYDAWVYGQLHEDETLYRGVQSIARELRDRSPSLVADTLAKGTIPTGTGRLVSYIVRGKAGGPALLVAVNAFDEPSGTVLLPGGTGAAIAADLAPHEVLLREITWPED
ncbi:MAG: beta-galactosidase [Armatimonadetes bacterium]|nr:beta-galactosidase [Armatimonadota bacterium]